MNKRVAVSILVALMVYPAFGFVAADMNPFNWVMDARSLLILCAVFAGYKVYTHPGWKDDA